MGAVINAVRSDSIRRYLWQSARPLSSMVFVVPLLGIYELGGALLGGAALRNGADAWLRHSLQSLGFQQHFLLPVLACGVLLGWHHLRRDRWDLHASVLPIMLVESLLCAFVLFSIAHVQHSLFHANLLVNAAPTSQATAGTIARLVGYCGAGIYEELLFRLILLQSAQWLFGVCGLTQRAARIWAVLSTSVLFAAAHYQLFSAAGYSFDWYSFSFRFVAGLFFGVLFVTRGFGIAAGAHAFYDILVELL